MQFQRSVLWFLPFAVTLTSCAGPGSAVDAVCGPDSFTPNYVSNVNLKKWTSLPIRVYFETSTNTGGVNIENETRQGFDDWETALGQNLWTEVPSAATANLVIRVQSSAPQSTLAETTIYFFQGQNIITRSEMVIYTWPSLPTGGYAGTGTHELGHALGINGHSDVIADIMYFTGNATDLLTQRDLNTLRTAYCGFGVSSKTAPVPAGTPLISQKITCPAP
jgi:hypothetical protein